MKKVEKTLERRLGFLRDIPAILFMRESVFFYKKKNKVQAILFTKEPERTETSVTIFFMVSVL